MKRIDLNGAWRFAKRGESPMPAIVPGCNYHDLLRLGKIDDPFYGENESKTFWVGEADFDYTRSFDLTAEDLEADRVVLACAQLDTLCRVYVNDMLIGEGSNCHIGYEFDVKKAVQAGENSLRIEFDSPVKYARAMAKKHAVAPDTVFRGRTHIRKPQCHFGWDWGPHIPVSGITGDIAIKLYHAARLQVPEITQRHEAGKVTLRVQAKAEMLRPGVELRVTVLSPEGDVLTQGGHELETVIENPQLWWTRELSGKEEQPLYTVRTEAIYNGNVVDVQERAIGLRTIALNRAADEYGHNFQFVLNGVPIFAKGANYIPPDSLPDRATREVKRGLLQRCLDANMNMVRIWGGGYYETDEFYDDCDRLGLLVWQDFAFACAPYPFDRKDFLQNVRDEVVYNVKRLRHHASLALWCGNNELEAMAAIWKPYLKLSRWVEKFFWHVLPDWVGVLDHQTPFINTSPTGGSYLKNVTSDDEGDTHLWQVWHGLQPLDFYRKRMTRFCSEFGLESLPSMETVRSFAKPEDWSLESPVFNVHQKCRGGNQKILYYLLSQYLLPKKFSDMLYLSQLTQAECVRDATEHWRRNRGRCNGSLYWQLNDCWPVCSWAGIDSLGRGKALHFAARRFFEPVAVSIEDSGRNAALYVINDTREARKLSLTWQLMNYEGRIIEDQTLEAVAAPALTARAAAKLRFHKDPRGLVLRVQLKDGDEVVSSRALLFGKPKDTPLPECSFSAQVEVLDDVAYITAKSDRFAQSVLMESDLTAGDFSDNFVDFFPGEEVTVTVRANGASAEEIQAGLRFTTVGNITEMHSAAYCKRKQAQMLLKPMNLATLTVFRIGLA